MLYFNLPVRKYTPVKSYIKTKQIDSLISVLSISNGRNRWA